MNQLHDIATQAAKFLVERGDAIELRDRAKLELTDSLLSIVRSEELHHALDSLTELAVTLDPEPASIALLRIAAPFVGRLAELRRDECLHYGEIAEDRFKAFLNGDPVRARRRTIR
jgi:hypothetical protein